MHELNFSLRQLQYFLVTAKHRSLRQAARALKIKQPSLSAQIKAMEEALQVELFERGRGGIQLTPFGRDLLPDARAVVNAVRNIREAAASASGSPAGTYRLGVSRSLGPYALPYVLPVLHQQYHDVKFFVRENVPDLLLQGLVDGEYDVIFSTLPIEDPAITVQPLFREPIYLVSNSNHPLADTNPVPAQSLKGQEILTIEEHYLFYRQVEAISKRFNAKLLRDYEGTSLDAIRQMVYMEIGIAFLPAFYVRSEIRERDNLCVMQVAGESIYRVHALAWRNTSRQAMYYRQFAEIFQAVLADEFGEDVVLL